MRWTAGRSRAWPRSCSSWSASSPSPRRCRSTPGCRTPASRPRRSPPCCTRRCWSRSASTSSRGCSWSPSPLEPHLADGRAGHRGGQRAGLGRARPWSRRTSSASSPIRTVSQIGFIFLGLASGNADRASAGGLLYILMHGLAKGGLFLCAGIVEQNTHTKDITKMGGLIKTMPVTAVSFLLCAFSVMGIPPFGGFFSKYMVIAAPSTAGHCADRPGVRRRAPCSRSSTCSGCSCLVFLGEPTRPHGERGLAGAWWPCVALAGRRCRWRRDPDPLAGMRPVQAVAAMLMLR